MKINFKEVRPARTKSYLKHKLISATAMLLVSSILMVSTSYAWYVLSTAPEVSNIKTQVGANGALEIALLDGESWTNLSLLDMGDIDESLEDQSQVADTVSNLTWGNLVNLDDASYGLDQIVLQPSRLNIMQDGTIYKVSNIPLKVPVYGEDGRVKSLDKTSAVTYTYDGNGFTVDEDYGVRAIGVVAGMSVYQQGLNTARSNLITYSASARTAASNILKSTGGGLATVVVDYAINKVDTFDDDDVKNILALAEGLQDSLDEIEMALRYAFAGYLTTKVASTAVNAITTENYQEKLTEITDGTKTLADLYALYPEIETVIAGDSTVKKTDSIEEYINKLTTNQTNVANAITSCNTLIDTSDSHSWGDLSKIISPLVQTDKMTVAGMTITTLKEKIASEGISNLASELMGSGGLVVTVPSDSGILSDIADFAGDYSADVTVAEVTYSGQTLKDQKATMTTDSDYDPTHLTDCSNKLRSAERADDSGSSAGITDYYGYALDLAFRTNAEDSSLKLQTEPENRIYEGDTRNAALQGGGSYMTFTTSAGLSATKMIKLMSGIRVVFMDDEQEVLAIAALDTTLGQNDYTILDAATQESTKMYAYMKQGTGDYQNSDLIDQSAYDLLEPESHVTFDKTTGKVTAKLYIQNFEMATRAQTDASGNVVTDSDGNIQYVETGALNLRGKATSDIITELLSDVAKKVTVLVYLDGSVVNNSMVAAESAQSMSGTLNLQFSSSAELVPATVTKLQSEETEITYTIFNSELYNAGYLSYDGIFCKVNEGFSIYTGSDNKLYFSTDTSTYTELTATNYTDALTVVTVTLDADPTSIAPKETTTLTATVSGAELAPTFVKTGDDSNAVVTHTTVEDNSSQITVTGVADGTASYYATVSVTVGGTTYTVKSNTITITVATAS